MAHRSLNYLSISEAFLVRNKMISGIITEADVHRSNRMCTVYYFLYVEYPSKAVSLFLLMRFLVELYILPTFYIEFIYRINKNKKKSLVYC